MDINVQYYFVCPKCLGELDYKSEIDRYYCFPCNLLWKRKTKTQESQS